MLPGLLLWRSGGGGVGWGGADGCMEVYRWVVLDFGCAQRERGGSGQRERGSDGEEGSERERGGVRGGVRERGRVSERGGERERGEGRGENGRTNEICIYEGNTNSLILIDKYT